MCFEHGDKMRLTKHIADVYKRFSAKLGWLHDSQAFLSVMLVARAVDNAMKDVE